MMSSNAHYRRALELLKEVEDFENMLGNKQGQPDVVMVLNQNMMRLLKKAELHMRMAEYKRGS